MFSNFEAYLYRAFIMSKEQNELFKRAKKLAKTTPKRSRLRMLLILPLIVATPSRTTVAIRRNGAGGKVIFAIHGPSCGPFVDTGVGLSFPRGWYRGLT